MVQFGSYFGAGAVTLLDDLGIKVRAGAPAIEMEEVLKMLLDGSIIYGDGSCHHDGCGGQYHEH